jgi:hypothetical protein
VEPLAPAVAQSLPRRWAQAALSQVRPAAAFVWARRWNLLGVAAVYALGRSCQFLAQPFQPLCELLARMARALPR